MPLFYSITYLAILLFLFLILARTERYWCPIKAAHKPKVYHNWYKDFADYGNPEEWEEKFNKWEESKRNN